MSLYDPRLLDRIEDLGHQAWDANVWRHMFGSYPPERENVSGARWNPPGTPAIYTSVERATALAEAEHQISTQPYRPKARRVLYELHVELESVVDLRDPHALRSVGLTREDVEDDNLARCQEVGGAVDWLGHDGLLVPSARADGLNLVIFIRNADPDAALDRISDEEVPR